MSVSALLPRWPRPQLPDARLRMSERIVLAGLLAAVVWVTDPFGLKLEKLLLSKHLPLLVFIVGGLLVLAGEALRFDRPATASAPVLPLVFPFVLLGLWILGGSLIARTALDIDNTFIISGLYLLAGLLTARVLAAIPLRLEFVSMFMQFSAACAVFMVARMAVEFRATLVAYHELEFFVVPMAVYFMLRHESPTALDRLAVGLFLVAGIVFRKNTGFIVLALVGAYLWTVSWRHELKKSAAFRFKFWSIAMLIALMAALTGAWLAASRGQALPSGNPKYRLATYQLAWNKFIRSPVVGSGFLDAATQKFTGFNTGVARNVLPTHSDVLDIAANGGLLALGLLGWGYARSLRGLRLPPAKPRERERWALCHTLLCMSLTAIPVYFFNPIMLQPAKSLILWSLLGMLLALRPPVAKAR